MKMNVSALKFFTFSQMQCRSDWNVQIYPKIRYSITISIGNTILVPNIAPPSEMN